MLLPAAGFVQAAGANPLTLTATVMLSVVSAMTMVNAYRSVLIMTRDGLIIRQLFGGGSRELLWADVKRAESHGPVIELESRPYGAGASRTTAYPPAQPRSVFQLDVGERAALAIARCYRRKLVSGGR